MELFQAQKEGISEAKKWKHLKQTVRTKITRVMPRHNKFKTGYQPRT